ncbi:MAG: helix-hairpin-helix domain-containing protein [Myxococcota bacterium]
MGCHGDGAALSGALPLLFGGGLDLARVPSAALEQLPRIGPQRGSALARARQAAPFCSAADLLRVPGIGPRTLAGLRPYLLLGTDPRCAARSALLDSRAGGPQRVRNAPGLRSGRPDRGRFGVGGP